MSTTTTTTVSSTSATASTTTAFRSSWNATGNTVAGVTQTTGLANNLLSNPYNLAVDTSNNIYVVDESFHRVQKWTIGATSGTTAAGQSGTCGSALNLLCYPSDVTLDANGNLYVLDGGNHRAVFWPVNGTTGTLVAGVSGTTSLSFDLNTKPVFSFRAGVSGSASNQLWGPLGMHRDASTGTLYISDSKNERVMRYLSGSTSGTVVAGGNGAGLSNNQLNNPRGVFYDASTSSLLIANNRGHNILRWVIGASSWTLVAGSSSGTFGSTALLLSYPTDVVLDSQGNLYVSDEGNHRIQFFRSAQSNGTTVAGVTGSSGSTALLLFTPSSVSVDNRFNIYVTDYFNYRVQRFSHQ